MNITQLIKTDPEIEVLSVLESSAEPLSSNDIYARVFAFEDLASLAACLNTMRADGLIENASPALKKMRFQATPAGKARLGSAQQPDKTVNAQDQSTVTTINTTTVTGKAEYDIPAFLRAEEPEQLIKSSEWEPTTTAFLMLKAMQHYPGSTMAQIQIMVGCKDAHEKYIPSYIKNGFVIVGSSKGVKTYTLKEGITALDAYDWRGRRKQKAMQELAEKLSATVSTESEMTVLPIRNPVRFAYTSDHSLLIIGLDHQTIELNPQHTQALVEFIRETITPVAVEML